jgi:hypothetical protein
MAAAQASLMDYGAAPSLPFDHYGPTARRPLPDCEVDGGAFPVDRRRLAGTGAAPSDFAIDHLGNTRERFDRKVRQGDGVEPRPLGKDGTVEGNLPPHLTARDPVEVRE